MNIIKLIILPREINLSDGEGDPAVTYLNKLPFSSFFIQNRNNGQEKMYFCNN